MNDFIGFLNEDIDAKKELLTSMPSRLKKDKLKYNEKLDAINNVYSRYQEVILKEMLKRYNIDIVKTKPIDNTEEINSINKKIDEIERYIGFINPINSVLDRLEFYKYLFVLYKYDDFTFLEINDAIENIIKIFELAGITITEDDFFYNYYVVKYMGLYLQYRKEKIPYNNLLSTFEEFYWHDSHLVKNIYLNFKSIIKKYTYKLNKYIDSLKNQYGIKNQYESLKKYYDELDRYYSKLEELNKESIGTIITKFINKEIDINNYFDNSKVRKEVYDNIQLEKVDINDSKQVKKFYSNLVKMEHDLKQYQLYYEINPMIEAYKKDFNLENINADTNKNYKRIISEIEKKEKKLKKIKLKYYSKIFNKLVNDSKMKQINIDCLELNKEINSLHREYLLEFMLCTFRPFYDNPITIDNILNLYHTFSFYRVINIRKIEDEALPIKMLLSRSKKFNKIAIDPRHDLVNVVPVYNDYDIKSVIITKHRLNNLNITNEDLDFEALDDVIGRVEMLLRYKTIKDQNISVEKINNIIKMDAILKKENLIKET